jgi:predicted Zn-dependent protease
LVATGEPPTNWEAQIEAIRQLAAGGYLEDAEEAGKILIDGIGDDQVLLRELLGEICIKSNRYRQAADYYLQTEKKAGDQGEAIRYGNALLREGILDQFEKLAFQSERIRAKFEWNCAVYEYKKNNFRKACRHLESLLEGSSLGLSAHYFYAQMQYRLGNSDEARKVIERGKYSYKWVDDASYEKLLRLQLRIAIEQGNEKMAEDLEAELRERESTDLGMLLLWKAMGLRRSGKSGEALKVLEELAAHFPDEANYLEGKIYEDDFYGRAEEALKLFEQLSKRRGRMAAMGKLCWGT